MRGVSGNMLDAECQEALVFFLKISTHKLQGREPGRSFLSSLIWHLHILAANHL